ncbi:hypothetical protein [Methanoculleus sp. UBA374]|jgi:hypothetical protein|uniref:hypothetical protein n=1 Tax=Methanoculleus sp. UBA374 TaxID=1915505 RepID=UPI00319E49E9
MVKRLSIESLTSRCSCSLPQKDSISPLGERLPARQEFEKLEGFRRGFGEVHPAERRVYEKTKGLRRVSNELRAEGPVLEHRRCE